MNSEIFKRFLCKYVDEAIDALGGLSNVRGMAHGQAMLLGWICARIHDTPAIQREWRNDDDPPGGIFLKELRRAQDYIRLRVETESTTA